MAKEARATDRASLEDISTVLQVCCPAMLKPSIGMYPFPALFWLAFFDRVVFYISDSVLNLLVAIEIYLPLISSPHTRRTLTWLGELRLWM